MARAKAKDSSELEDMVETAGDAMMLLISRSTFEVMRLQAASDGSSVGAVLSTALAEYIEKHGCAEAKLYLRQLEQRNPGLGGRHAAG